MIRQVRLSAIWVLVAGILISSCSATREQSVEDELTDFRAWVNEQTSDLTNRTKEDWQQAKQDFRTRTAELDQQQDNFSDELKEEYKQLKQVFTDADDAYERSLRDKRMNEWERNLLERWADMTTINENSVGEAYATFLENVRLKKDGWNENDWEMANMVFEELNERKEEIAGNIQTETEVRIKALQMEFQTLQNAAAR
ncbi:hypothetical protein CLV24_104252 [Pontibacter ummariensis]|uniref:Uncharacterized protein n=1 Tax=Pontibacter ummariensis TaxID=1610492 RepID=A0A239DI28_9BACT|nr:hypothetical protein [Pontibacter ummariensis]PRY14439.1 hypothetical protein CLV24_104252 [Pontibacter ummariensis]SNS32017.1 hypothetical protein SAMN06296052_104251 [Pontibacter ummariensis]